MSAEETYKKYEDLADGTTLITLKQDYLKNRDRESLVSLLSCLRESFVWVPMNVKMSERDEQRLRQAAKDKTLDSFKAIDEMRIAPEILTMRDGRRFFPMFSRKVLLPERYRKGNGWTEWVGIRRVYGTDDHSL